MSLTNFTTDGMESLRQGSNFSPTAGSYIDVDTSTTSDGALTSWTSLNASANESDGSFDLSVDLTMAYNILLEHQFLQEIEAARRRHGQPSVIVLIVLYAISFVVGLVGNTFVLYAVAKFRHMRTVTNAFLANLAVSDLLVVLVCMPISLGMEIYVHWIYGPFMCRLVPFIQGVSVTSSMLTLTAVSLNRYYAIRKPLKARSMFTAKSVSAFITGIWVISIATVSPILYVNDIEAYKIEGVTFDTLCRELHWPSKEIQQMYGVVVFLLTYFVPLLFTLAVYLLICQRLWNHDKKLRNEPVHASNQQTTVIENQLKGRRKVVKMLFILVSLFAVSWLPYFTTQIYLDFVFDSHALEIHAFFLWLGLSNSSVNPICYCFMSERFKNCFRTICCCWSRFRTPRKCSHRRGRYTAFSRSRSPSFFRSTRTESVRFSAVHTTLQYSMTDRLAVPASRFTRTRVDESSDDDHSGEAAQGTNTADPVPPEAKCHTFLIEEDPPLQTNHNNILSNSGF